MTAVLCILDLFSPPFPLAILFLSTPQNRPPPTNLLPITPSPTPNPYFILIFQLPHPNPRRASHSTTLSHHLSSSRYFLNQYPSSSSTYRSRTLIPPYSPRSTNTIVLLSSPLICPRDRVCSRRHASSE